MPAEDPPPVTFGSATQTPHFQTPKDGGTEHSFETPCSPGVWTQAGT